MLYEYKIYWKYILKKNKQMEENEKKEKKIDNSVYINCVWKQCTTDSSATTKITSEEFIVVNYSNSSVLISWN